MSDVAIAEPTKRQIGRREASKPGRVTGRLKQALDLMAWDNATDYEAAVKTGLTLTAIRLALQRPHVRAYFRSQATALLEREHPRNHHTLIEVRDQKDNQMARVQAVRTMMAMDEQVLSGRASAANTSTPGITIRVVTVVQQNSENASKSADDSLSKTVTIEGNQ